MVFLAGCLAHVLLPTRHWDPFFSTVWFPISIAVILATLIQLFVLDRLTRHRVLIAWLIIGLALLIPYALITIYDYEFNRPHELF